MDFYDFDKELIFTAYKKLKHYYYYDNTTLVTRKRIAVFEAEHLAKLKKKETKEKLKMLVDKQMHAISDGMIDINPYILPKKIKKSENDIISNYKDQTEIFEVERLNILADATVEIHIISTLWVMMVGRYLSQSVSENNYAYRMTLDINEENDLPWENLKLYEPYFVQYQKWRDLAIEKADALLDEKRNVTMLSLDIKDYFHSVDLNFEELDRDTNDMIDEHYMHSVWKQEKDHINQRKRAAAFLNQQLHQIHQVYAMRLESYHPKKSSESRGLPLPIGLISSGLLGNYYLNLIDKQLIEQLNPAYYGRYVDDLMFVFSDLSATKSKVTSTINSFINQHLVKKNILEFSNAEKYGRFFNDNGEYLDFPSHKKEYQFEHIDQITIDKMLVKNLTYKLQKDPGLEIQSAKVAMHFFDFRESKAALNIFKMKLEEQRSEFRFLPDEDEVSEDFDRGAFSLQYNDSVNKFRSIQDFTEDKYGASKFLAKKIFARNFGNKENDEKTDQQILTFFKEHIAISFYSLWEKVATYFVVCGQGENLVKFKRNVELAIARVSYILPESDKEDVNLTLKLKEQLLEQLRIAIAIPLALNPNLKKLTATKQELHDFSKLVEDYAMPIRTSNLFRQSLVNLPFLNFTKFLYTKRSLLNFNPDFLSMNEPKQVEKGLGLLAPNYVPFHEVNIFQVALVINTLNHKRLKDSLPLVVLEKANQSQKLDIINRIPDVAFKHYYKVNYHWKKTQRNRKELKSTYFNIEPDGSDDGKPTHINIEVRGDRDAGFDHDQVNKKVAIANMKVSNKNIKSSIRKQPNLSKARRKEVFELLNMADKNDADLIVFPEVSIPYAWIRLLTERSHKRYMGIIAGLEHWINGHNFAFNFMVTILPFKVNHYTTSLIKIRLKNHYSPSETSLLGGNRLLVPGDTIKEYPKMYDLFHWRKTYFSVYNCFELANINHRGIFKSKVDFLIASEYNPDTNYFSDVAGSWVRDVHCFFIQVNSSDFGDSRLIQPSKSYSKDLIQVKGGINSTVLVGELNIDQLREFQYVEHNLQRDMIEKGRVDLKHTPPDFDTSAVEKRIYNKNLNPRKK
jgi:hypothetical protein